MARRSSAIVGDLKPIGELRFLGVMDSVQRAPSWLIVTVSCLVTLTSFAIGGGIWIAEYDHSEPHFVANPFAADRPPPVAIPVVFPSWAEVPHLAGSSLNDPATSPSVADQRPQPPRAFQTIKPEAIGLGPLILPSASDQPAPQMGATPLDAQARTIEPIKASPSTPSAPAMVEVVLSQPNLTSTNAPGPVQRAWTPTAQRQTRRPIVEVRRSAEPDRDAEQTASLIEPPKSKRPQVDTAAVVRASVRRLRREPSSSAQAPSDSTSSWTLPPALAPSP